jgi:peptide deformylase
MALARVLPSIFAAALVACGPPASKPMSTAPPDASPATPAIVQAGAPVLRARAVEVAPERIPTAEIQELIKTMIAAMRAAPGVGLAAPQIGVSLRVLVLEDTADRMAKLTADELHERERALLPVRVFINPVLRPVGESRRMFFEGCLSVDGFAALVERYAEVEVSGLDERGQPQTMQVRGWPARILQHEVDHLDGTLYVDRMVSRSFSTGEQVKERFAGKPIAEVLAMFGLAPPA